MHAHRHDHAPHGHPHDHGDDHAHAGHAPPGGPARARERQRLGWALVATAVILVAEVLGGIWSHSLALLSDAGHMFSDVVAQALSLAAMILAMRPADKRRTYGWHRLEILVAQVNGVALIVLALGILWSGWVRLHAPVEVSTGLMLSVAAIGLVSNVVGAWLLHDAQTLTARSAYLHVLLDGLSSVAVMVAGTVMFFAHGMYWLDPALSMVIGVFIFYSAYRLVREAVDVLLETVPRDIDLAGVTHAIDAVEGVRAVHDLHIWTITSGLYALSAHIVLGTGVEGRHDAILAQVNEVLKQRFAIEHTTLQIESAGFDHECHVC